MAKVSVECRINEVAKRCICMLVATCVYVWRFMIIYVCPSFIQHPAHFISSTTPAGVRYSLPPFI